MYTKKVSIEYIYQAGHEVIGRASKRLGTLAVGSPEDRRFRGIFGVSAYVTQMAWAMMEEHGLLPDHNFHHFLWALAFMRTYPANDHALSQLLVLGGSDPKTINKYMWPFIHAVFDLNYESEVVSDFPCYSHLPFFQVWHSMSDIAPTSDLF